MEAQCETISLAARGDVEAETIAGHELVSDPGVGHGAAAYRSPSSGDRPYAIRDTQRIVVRDESRTRSRH